MNIDYPYHFERNGRTGALSAAPDEDDDPVRDMIEQFLFTSAGERVMRPEFGSGLLQMIFAPNSPDEGSLLRTRSTRRSVPSEPSPHAL